MKKRWYDFLWIASLIYLALGFFNILFAWLGLLCFFLPLFIALSRGHQRILQPLLWTGAALGAARRPLWPFQKKGHPPMDEEPGLPL